jgi:hypothetical protein
MGKSGLAEKSDKICTFSYKDYHGEKAAASGRLHLLHFHHQDGELELP